MEQIRVEKYDEDNFDHKYVTVLLDNDADFHKYVGDTYYLLKNTKEKQALGYDDEIYIAYANQDPIGLVELRILDDKPYISISIIPESRGYHYGKVLFSHFIEYLFQLHSEYEEVYASINPENIISINNVLSLGFNRLNQTKYVKKRN